jgi:DNA-binding MarR family transcriptional regulator
VTTDAPAEAPPGQLIRALAGLLALTEPPLLRLWRSAGLTFTQRRLLRHLRGGPRGAGELALASGLSAPSLTRLVARLERRGYVRRTVDEADRRRIVVTLTSAGERVLADHRVFREAGLVAAARALEPEARVELARRLEELVRLASAAAETPR